MAELVIGVLVLTACVYGASSAAKLSGRRGYAAFRAGLAGTALVPGRLLPAVAAVLAGAEAVVAAGSVAAAVLAGAGLTGARPAAVAVLSAAAALTAVLAAGITVVIRTGTHATCACFGVRPGRTGPVLGGPHLARDLALLALLVTALLGTLAGWALAGGQGGAGQAGNGHVPAGAALIAALAGVVVALLAIMLDDLIALFTPVRHPAAR
jgi:energy-converting hydrogenase Eha subunit A